MNKAELIEVLAARFMMSKRDAAAVVQAIFDAMAAAVVRGDKIELRGFGSFHVRLRGARVRRNPRTGALVDIPAHRVLSFRPGKEVRRLLAGSSTAR